MAKIDAWMPLYIGDYLRDTRGLTTEEHGAYLLLMMEYWVQGPLPESQRKLSRIAGLTGEAWEEAWESLQEYFTLRNGEWHHKRIDAELAKAEEKSRRASERASRAAKAKHAATSTPDACDEHAPSSATSMPQACPEQCPGDAPSPSPSPSPKQLPKDSVSNETVVISPCENDPPECEAALEAYNEVAEQAGWPKAQKLTKQRRSAIRQRLRDCGGLEGWRAAMAQARASPFLCGDNDRGWKANLDFFLQAKSFTKLMEGGYANSRPDRYDVRDDLGLNAELPSALWPDQDVSPRPDHDALRAAGSDAGQARPTASVHRGDDRRLRSGAAGQVGSGVAALAR